MKITKKIKKFIFHNINKKILKFNKNKYLFYILKQKIYIFNKNIKEIKILNKY